ncbi:sugar transferase [Limnohabitans sp. B9-3]|uniref:sugar transferase n=1 Tax=Limnohabitans sp. B9-3 TaxID=1100707 RepID=UPI000C1F0D24|nr:sugar transferase [Limnohabitans sp. B9-3]PIT72388.1 lipid carrier--UDP-N-acetylgalactosaminyltransferase [Limnohabitans sp. B9-3]
MQRFLDIFFSGLALLVLAPLLLPIALMLRLTGEGEIFFLQERVGKDGKPFKLYKFATMLKNSPYVGTGTVTVKNDPRVLPMGHFLRRTKINELPQLLNILLGSMSVVGPRPQARKNFEAFPMNLQKLIIQVRPGLSGIGSVIFRGEEDILADYADNVNFYDKVIAPYKGQVEAWYVENQSMFTYFAVIFITIWVVIFSSSRLVWRVFKGLPIPPDTLKGHLNYLAMDA